MKVLGLTGGIGMGKSTADKLLRARNIPVIDTDILARELVEPGKPALIEIQNAFGLSVIAPDGTLRRDLLAAIVFVDPAKRKVLENILHPRIRAAWLKQIAEWRTAGHALAVVVIPLLFETAAEQYCDRVICIACSGATQLRRLLARNWSVEQIQGRNAAQLATEEKMRRSDFVVWTEGTQEMDGRQLEKILQFD